MEVKNYFATDTQGNVLGSAQVYLYLAGTTTLATGLQNISGAALANPFTSQSNGLVQFKATDGDYDLRVVKPGREFTIRIQCFDGVVFSAALGIDGSFRIGYEGSSLGDYLGTFRKLANYSAARAYTGSASVIEITNTSLMGRFTVRPFQAGDVDDGGSVLVSNDGLRTMERQFLDNSVWVNWWGAKGDDTQDNSVQFNNAAIFINKIGGGRLNIPSGKFRFSDSSSRNFRFWGNIKIRGAGIDRTVIIKDPSNSSSSPLIHTEIIDSKTDRIEISDISVVDRWGSVNYTDSTNNTVYITNSKNVLIERVSVNGSGAGSIYVEGCDHVTAQNNIVSEGKRDGIRILGSITSRVINNNFDKVLDDSIAIHLPNAISLARSFSLVEGNTIIDSQGITCLGAKVIVVSSNNLIRCMVRGVRAGADTAAAEGNTALLSTTVVNNNIVDLFNGAVFGWADLADGIYVNTVQTLAKDNVEQAVGGVVVKPYPYLYTNDTSANGTPNAGSYNLTVSGNKVVRTLAPTSLYSNYGFGQRLSQSGYVDPPIAIGDFCRNSLKVEGTLRDTMLSANTLSGSRFGLYILGGTSTTYTNIRDLIVRGNIFSNISEGAVLLNGTGVVDIVENTFDLDPFLESPSRNPDGSWQNTTAVRAILRLNAGISAVIDGCTFKNMSSPVDTAQAYSFSNSKIYIDPVSDGSGGIIWKGMNPNGSVRQIDANTVIIEDCDPNSSGFRLRKSTCPKQATSLPTSGTFPAGYFLENSSTASALRGWKRITTGSNHVLGTDWIAV